MATEAFNIFDGVIQGDALAPHLFLIVLDCAVRTAIGKDDTVLGFVTTPRQSRNRRANVLIDIDFADDVSVLSNTTIPRATVQLNQHVIQLVSITSQE